MAKPGKKSASVNELTGVPFANPVVAYHAAMVNGEESVGHWVRLLYDLLVDGIDSGRFFYDDEKATDAIRFIETFCRHNKGKLAPGLLKLELWQKAIVAAIFGIVDHDGLRQFR